MIWYADNYHIENKCTHVYSKLEHVHEVIYVLHGISKSLFMSIIHIHISSCQDSIQKEWLTLYTHRESSHCFLQSTQSVTDNTNMPESDKTSYSEHKRFNMLNKQRRKQTDRTCINDLVKIMASKYYLTISNQSLSLIIYVYKIYY